MVTAHPARQEFVSYLKEQIPDLIVVMDQDSNAMHTYLRALEMTGQNPCVILEDDVELTGNFCAKLDAAISERPDRVIQFFSMRKADIEIGSRWDTGSRFMMNQCTYFPAGYAAALRAFRETWDKREVQWRSGKDLLVAAFLKSRRERYWIHVPSLVQHRVTRSIIDRRRSMFRRSLTFQEE